MSLWSRRCVPVLLAAVAVAVSGCNGLLGSPPQRQLYRLTAVTRFPAGLPHVAGQLIVAAVNAPAGLDTRRIALLRTPLSLDYYAGSAWSDRLPELVRTLLAESIENSGAFAAVGSDPLSLHGDYRLETELRDFETVYDSPDGAPAVKIAMLLKLVRLPDEKIVAQTLIAERQAAPANAIPAVVATFNAAFARALERSAIWVADKAALSPPRR